jgi:hypothetical protein
MNFQEKNTDYEVPPAKMHPARLVGIFDIGKQPGSVYDGKEIKPANKVILVYELLGKDKMTPKEGQVTGDNFSISEFTTVSLHVKGTLIKRLQVFDAPVKKKSEDWYEIDPKFNMSTMLGEACMVEVSHNEAGKAKITAVTKPIDGLVVPEYTAKLSYLDLDSEDWLDNYNIAPKWIQELVDKKID